MDPFQTKPVEIPNYEYDVDTGDIVYPSLFPDDEPSTVVYNDSADQSLSLETDDGGYTTITNLIAEGIRSKSTFEVVEVDASSYCVSESLQSGTNVTSNFSGVLIGSTENSPRSFPDGAIIDDRIHDEYAAMSSVHGDLPGKKREVIAYNENEDPSVCERSTALSSLTNTDSFFPRWLNPRDRVDILFDPFRDAMRPPPSATNEHLAIRETTGLNRLILASTKNLSSIFRPRPHPEFHLNHKHPAVAVARPPENLIISATNSPSVCSTSSGINKKSNTQSSISQAHSVTQLMNNDVRERYGAAVMRSYKQHGYQSPVPHSYPLDEIPIRKENRKKILLLIACFSLLIIGVVSVAVVTGGDDESGDYVVSNSAEAHRKGSNGSLPEACCIESTSEYDDMTDGSNGVNLEDKYQSSAFEHLVVAFPADSNKTEILVVSNSTDDALEKFNGATIPSLEPIGDTAVVSLASSQNNDSPPSPPNPTASHVASPHVASIHGTDMEGVFSAKLGARSDAPTNSIFTISPSNTHESYLEDSLSDPTNHPNSKPMLSLSIQSSTQRPTIHTSLKPSARPTPLPSYPPSTKKPSKTPTRKPSQRPTRGHRTTKPSHKPTPRPTPKPFVRDVSIPVASTETPTDFPSLSPIKFPTLAPSTYEPSSAHPTERPSSIPSMSPIRTPSDAPSLAPTRSPVTAYPSKSPSTAPVTADPSVQPTPYPMSSPPSIAPTTYPTISPSFKPSAIPVASPSHTPTSSPSSRETSHPSPSPSFSPSKNPTLPPSDRPKTLEPSLAPFSSPSQGPSPKPSMEPSPGPSPEPSPKPSMEPSPGPSPEPSYRPTDCSERKFSFAFNLGCSNISDKGMYDTLESCCDIQYGSFEDCVFVDICGIYTDHPTLRPTNKETTAPTNEISPQPTIMTSLP